jgi:hypothetical protein
MPGPLATLAEFEARLGETLTGSDEVRAEALLEDASTLVRDVAEEPDWTDTTAPPRAIQITLAVALRAYNNPDGLISERLGDASWGWWHGTQPGVYLTKDEEQALRRLGGTAMRSATLVSPYSGTPEDELPL